MPWLLENIGFLTGDAWRTWVEINPATAEDQGVTNGERVAIESDAGRVEARVRVFAGAQPGVLNVPYGLHTNVEGWGRVDAANPLVVIGNRVDDETGLPDWYSTRVRIVRT
jgi:anaerobic selenocysteine-containing dehydrogenase